MRWTCELGCVLFAIVLSGCRDEPRADAPASARDTSETPRVVGELDAELRGICDSIGVWLGETMSSRPDRTDGEFVGSAFGVRRQGCRITAADTLRPDVPERPLERVWAALAAYGWEVEPAYLADSPEGSMLALRSGSLLCVLQHFWAAQTDDERATTPVVPTRYDLSAECFREVRPDR